MRQIVDEVKKVTGLPFTELSWPAAPATRPHLIGSPKRINEEMAGMPSTTWKTSSSPRGMPGRPTPNTTSTSTPGSRLTEIDGHFAVDAAKRFRP